MKLEFRKTIKEALVTLDLSPVTYRKVLKDKYGVHDFIDYDNPNASIALKILDCLCLQFIDVTGYYRKDIHVFRICNTIEANHFDFKVNKRAKQYLKEFRKNRWQEDKQFKNLRGCWNTRLQRWFPNSKLRIPALDEFMSHRILRYFSLFRLLCQRRAYYKKNGTYDGINWFDKRWDKEVYLKNEKVIIVSKKDQSQYLFKSLLYPIYNLFHRDTNKKSNADRVLCEN